MSASDQQDPGSVDSFPFESRGFALADLARAAASDSERRLLTGFLIQYLDFAIARGTEQQLNRETPGMWSAMLVASHQLNDPRLRDAVLRWLEELIDEARDNMSQQSVLHAGLFELMFLRDPSGNRIDWSVETEAWKVAKVIRMCLRTDRRWLLWDAYEDHPIEHFVLDVRECQQWCLKHGIVPPAVGSDEEIREWFNAEEDAIEE